MAKESPAEIAQKYSIAPFRQGEFLHNGPIFLYSPTSYKPSILMGRNPESSVAIVTGWSDPEAVVSSEIMDEVAIAASTRTPVGVQLMLANLARNPHIRTLVRRAVGANNQTDRGQVTIQIMDALFKKERDTEGNIRPTVDDEGNIIGTSFKLRPELFDGGGLWVVREVLKNVELVDLNKDKSPDILATVKAHQKQAEPYFPLPVNLPEFTPPALETWPSEKFGIMTRGTDAFETWIRLMDKVIRYGSDAILESATIDHPQLGNRSELRVWELPFAMVALDGTNPFPAVPEWVEQEEALTLTPKKLENYYQDAYRPESHKKEIFPGVFVYEKDNKYKYGEEAHMYPNNPDAQVLYQNIAKITDLETANRAIAEGMVLSEGTLKKVAEVMGADLSDEQKAWVLSHVYFPPVNQYKIAVERLKTVTEDADKVIMFYNPVTHGQLLSGRPCLNRMGILSREGALHALAEFRTHDSKSWLENVYGVWRTIQDMASETGHKVGKIITVSDSLHIYQQDRDWIVRLWQEQFCDKEVPMVFDESNSDPRGEISITVSEGKVSISLLKPVTGDVIAQFEPKSLRESLFQLGYFGWTSQQEHALYIGSETATAFLAAQLDGNFIQDQPQVTRRSLQEKMESE